MRFRHSKQDGGVVTSQGTCCVFFFFFFFFFFSLWDQLLGFQPRTTRYSSQWAGLQSIVGERREKSPFQRCKRNIIVLMVQVSDHPWDFPMHPFVCIMTSASMLWGGGLQSLISDYDACGRRTCLVFFQKAHRRKKGGISTRALTRKLEW